MRVWAVVALAIVMLVSKAALGQDASRAECASAYELGQKLRNERRLLAARSELLRCVSDDCPDVARRDCHRWLVEVEASMPTVVFEVFGKDGRELDDVRIAVDGRPLLDRNDGKAYAVDPGVRRFRFQIRGARVQEKNVVVREGEKNRKVVASFFTKPDRPKEEPKEEPLVIPAGVWAFGAVSAATLTVALVVGVVGVEREKDLRATCGATDQGCAQSDVDQLVAMYVAADISLAVGILSAGSAVLVYLIQSPSSSSASFYGDRLRVRF